MRKLTCILLAILISTSFLTAFAEEAFQIQVIAEDETISVNVSGVEGLVTLLVLKNGTDASLLDEGTALGDIAVHFDQLTANDRGVASFKFKMPTKYKTGKYDFCIFNNGPKTPHEFQYFDKNAKSDVIKLINEAQNINEIIDVMSNPVNLEALTFNFEPYNRMVSDGTDMTFIYQNLLDHPAFDTEDAGKIISYLKEISLINFINQSTNNEAILELMLAYTDILKLNTNDNSYLYSLFSGLSKAEQLRVIGEFDRNCITVDDISVAFRECVFSDAIRYIDYFKSVETLLNNTTALLRADIFSVYNQLRNKDAVLQKVSNEKYENINSFCEQFILFANQQYNLENTPVQPGTNGGGGGGGGGGGQSINVTPPVSQDDENKTPSDKKEFFSDLDSVPWAKDAVYSLYNRNIIHGKTPDTFSPNDYITRKEFTKIIVLACDSIEKYNDVSFCDITISDWSYPYICRAYEMNIIKGTGADTFSPKAFITREDMAVIIYRLSEIQKVELNSSEATVNFTDKNDISGYALKAITALYNSGLITGTSKTTVSPKEYATRAQAAKIIYDYLEFKGEN